MFTRSACLAAVAASAAAFQPTLRSGAPAKVNQRATCAVSMSAQNNAKVAVAGLAALPLIVGGADANALTSKDINNLTYEEVKGTGIANRCPEVASNGEDIILQQNTKYKITDLCLEPKSFQIETEVQKKRGESRREFVDTKLVTRATYSLAGVEGPLFYDKDGSLTFQEKEGLDYAATTVQLPGGERVPFFFTIKELVAKATAPKGISPGTEFGGTFTVPSYRSGLFLDPKGRGATTGYDMAQALPAFEADGNEGQAELFKENNKVFQVTDGSLEFAVNKVDGQTGEFSGVFVSEQLSDTDMGSKAPKKVLVKGIVYGKVSTAAGDEGY